MSDDAAFREQIVHLLKGDQAHMTFDDAVAGFPASAMNTRPPNVSYTPWHLLEHLRITQQDILAFTNGEAYVELRWPEDYWPAPDATADQAAWDTTIRQFRTDLAALIALARDPANDLHAPVKHATGDEYALARELFTVAAHNSYHIGEFAILRQVMDTWPPDHDK
jgi:hypothetical protein